MVDPPDNIQLRKLQWLLLVSSVVSIVFLLLAAFEENLTGQWRDYQKQYRDQLVEKAQSPQARQAANQMEIGLKQIYLPGLNRTDRCVTCHVGIQDPNQTQSPQPLQTHSGDLLTHHPVDKFGCSICHEGQGQAVSTKTAHGLVGRGAVPLLRGESIYNNCGKCHYENDLYDAEYDLYVQNKSLHPLDETELSQSVPGTQNMSDRAIGRGKQLVLDEGCLGCHQYRGRGGKAGPDITYVGDKTPHDFDFKAFDGQHTVAAWLFAHFKNPDAVSPGTSMPDLKLTDQQARDLATYMLSLKRKNVPASYTPVPDRRAGKPVQAPRLYAMYCSACHGSGGKGVSYFNDRNTSVPALKYLAERLGLYDPQQAQIIVKLLKNHTDLVTLVENPPFDSDVYEEVVKQLQVMRDVIRNGRPGVKKDANSPLDSLNMPAWKDNLTDDQIDDLLAYLINLFPWDEE